MATIFTENYSGDYGHLYEFKAEASESSVSIANNTSLVSVSIYVRRTNSSANGAYNNDGTDWSITIDGTKTSGNSKWDTRNSTEWKLLGSASKTITHNADGSKSIAISATHTGNSASGSSKMGNSNGSGTFTLTKIARYATASHSLNSKGIDNIKMNWSSDSNCDLVQYKIGNGNWVTASSSTAKSGSYTISGLSPAAAYSIYTRVRRADSQLYTETTALSVTTHDIAKISTAGNFNLGSNASVTITNPAGATANMVMKIGNTQILNKTLATGANTITFTDAQLDTIYKKFTTTNSVTVSYVLTTNNNSDWTNTKTATCTLTGNQKTAKIGQNGVKRAKVYVGKSGVKKAIVWIGDSNNIPRRCI